MTGTIRFCSSSSPDPVRSVQLPKSALRRIEAAEIQLRLDIGKFLQACLRGEARPNPSSLEPFFETYVDAVLDETAKHLLPRITSPEKFISTLQRRADILQTAVCTENGTWVRVVRQSFDEANLIHLGNSKIGYHDPSEFTRPRRRAVKEALRLRVLYWQKEASVQAAVNASRKENRLNVSTQRTGQIPPQRGLLFDRELFQKAKDKRRHKNKDILEFFGVKEESTVSRWLNGQMAMSAEHAKKYDQYIAILTPEDPDPS